jgi:hypothetical protein
MATGSGQEPAAADRSRLRAGHADREHAIEVLKAAFVQGMLAKDEFDLRMGQALAARTYADLAALTADLPTGLAVAGPARPPVRIRRRPMARAAAGTGGSLAVAAAAVWGAFILDPGPFARNTAGPPGFLSPGLMFVIAFAAVILAFGITLNAVVTSRDQRRSRGQLPPRPGPGGHALGGGQRGSTGQGPALPGPGEGHARVGLQAHKPPQHRQNTSSRVGRAPRGARPAPGTV